MAQRKSDVVWRQGKLKTFVGAIYTHFRLSEFVLSSSMRTMASSNNTVFPLPVGADEE
jgi:hypothetical protein